MKNDNNNNNKNMPSNLSISFLFFRLLQHEVQLTLIQTKWNVNWKLYLKIVVSFCSPCFHFTSIFILLSFIFFYLFHRKIIYELRSTVKTFTIFLRRFCLFNCLHFLWTYKQVLRDGIRERARLKNMTSRSSTKRNEKGFACRYFGWCRCLVENNSVHLDFASILLLFNFVTISLK